MLLPLISKLIHFFVFEPCFCPHRFSRHKHLKVCDSKDKFTKAFPELIVELYFIFKFKDEALTKVVRTKQHFLTAFPSIQQWRLLCEGHAASPPIVRFLALSATVATSFKLERGVGPSWAASASWPSPQLLMGKPQVNCKWNKT